MNVIAAADKKLHCVVASNDNGLFNRLENLYNPAEVQFTLIPLGKDAVRFIEHQNPNILLIDYHDQPQNCVELCQILKNTELTAHIPIIILSSENAPVNKTELFKSGALDIININTEDQEVIAKLNAHLKTSQLTRQLGNFNQYLEQKLKHRTRETELAFKNLQIKNDELIHLTMELEGQKDRYEQVIQGANIGTFDMNLETRQVTRNAIAAHLIGYTLADLNDDDIFWDSLTHPDDLLQLKQVRQGIEDGKLKTFQHEFRIKHKNGQWIWLSIKGKITSEDQNGKPLRISGIYNNITERKEASIALQRSELALKEVVQNTNNKFGQDFFNSIVITLNQITNADFSFVGRLLPDKRVQSIAICHRGKLIDNFIYSLDGTPCDDVISKTTCVFSKDVCKLYPKDDLLIQMGIDAYVGTPVFGYQNRPLGIIVSLFAKPIEDAGFITSIFEIFEAKVGSEIERTETEKAYKENQQLLLKAQSIGQMGHWIIDYEKNTMSWSNEIYKIFEVKVKDFNHQPNFFYQFTLAEDAEAIKDKFKQALRTHTEYNHSHPIRLKNGTIKYIHERADFEYDSNGKVRYAVGITQDVTEQTNNKLELLKHKENLESMVEERTNLLNNAIQELANRNTELNRTNQKINEQNIKLETTLKALKEAQANLVQFEKMASLGVLVAGVAHEINNPVNFISSGIEGVKTNAGILFDLSGKYLQQLQKNNASEDLNQELQYLQKVNSMLEKSIQGIEIGVERTTSIVKGLRSFSRTDENKATLVNLHENLENTLIILYHQYKNRITIHKHFGRIPEILAKGGLLNQLFMNIISNAIQAIEGEGNITITTEHLTTEKLIQIKIADDGTGISPVIIDKIFDPFFTTKEVGKGTGLGLSIAYNIAKEHHGDITVNSKVGIGTEFIIKLPT